MNFLITGGAGFVGSYVVEKLLEHNPKKIFIVDNMIRGSQRNMASFINNPKVEFIQDDIRNQKLMEKLINESDYCFHLAALRINRCAENPVEAFDVMVKANMDYWTPYSTFDEGGEGLVRAITDLVAADINHEKYPATAVCDVKQSLNEVRITTNMDDCAN